MNNTVSFETASAMKDAGFPQPEPEMGQFWYNKKGVIHVVFIEGGDGRCFLSVDEGGDAWPCADEGYVFAPQAHDILAQLPDGYRLTRANKSMFICTEIEAVTGDSGCKDNPHEAAAKAFLELAKRPSAG